MSDVVCDQISLAASRAAHSDDVKERANRVKRRPKQDRGLPDDEELLKFAETYLVTQRQLWPDLVAQGVLPEPTPEVLAAMAEDFKMWHRGAVPNAADVQALRLAIGTAHMAGVYVRFSSDNSNIASNRDQLVKCLRKAKLEGRFVPWQYVRADYAVGGRIAFGRLGYESYKAALADHSHYIGTTYIDDFSRASRQEMEWLRLVNLSKRLEKRLISVSDGFALNSEHSTMLASVNKMGMEQWMQQHRQKVRRGMLAAAQRGTRLEAVS